MPETLICNSFCQIGPPSLTLFILQKVCISVLHPLRQVLEFTTYQAIRDILKSQYKMDT